MTINPGLWRKKPETQKFNYKDASQGYSVDANEPERSRWIGWKGLKLDDGDGCATLQKIIELCA